MHPLLLTAEIVDRVADSMSAGTKSSIKSFLSIIFNDKLYHAIFLLILMIVMIKLVDLIFHPFKGKTNIHVNFLRSVIKVLIAITFILRIGALSEAFSQFYNSILMSSSLIVVVLGFIFQEGLSNIIHGFLLTLSKPFDIGDRIHVTIDGEQITGYVKSISMRNTTIQTVTNNTTVIIPNAKMDMCLIDNSHFDAKTTKSNFLDVSITYESNADKAMLIMGQTIAEHPLVRKVRPAAEKNDPVNVLVCNLAESSVVLRASVLTATIEENFQACSDIRKELLRRFAAEDDVEFAYPHVDVHVRNSHPCTDGMKVTTPKE